jgi:transcriptional regulator with XRE-family HTH domain
MKFADKLQDLRKSKGLSQEELAIKLNVVRQTVSKWENGVSPTKGY